jgi:phosphoribosylaminoimidazolecarboxamide formyltransferase/IMP cyclohydrolase
MADIPITRALISVSDKTGIVDFATSLASYDIELISTGGTAKTLEDAGLTTTDVSSITGFPEMLDGRVKTLHPAVHGGLLGVRDNPSHVTSMSKHSIEPIDLVCIDLYPFEETISRDDVSDEEVIEQIDIGGPAMIRSAAKNHSFVTVITSPDQYNKVLDELESNNGATTSTLRSELAKDAFNRTASYDSIIATWMEGNHNNFPRQLRVQGKLKQMLRYGENPNQEAAVYNNPLYQGQSVVSASVLAGKPLSYNNLMDAAASLELVQDIYASSKLPTAAIIKHANPCGAAIADSISEAFVHAWECDPLASFGGIVSLSHQVDEELAQTISAGEKFLEVIVAPSYSDKAIVILQKRWKNIRLLAVGSEPKCMNTQQFRSVDGGFLVQESHQINALPSDWDHVAGPKLDETKYQDATLAWVSSAHLKSNAIAIVDNRKLIGGGMGQVDRVTAAKIAIERAGEQLHSSIYPIAASDAFFPFPDAPMLLINAGVRCLIQPGGSVRDQETIDVCEQNKITLLHTGSRCFRH